MVGTCSVEHWLKAPELTYRIWSTHNSCRFDQRCGMHARTKTIHGDGAVELAPRDDEHGHSIAVIYISGCFWYMFTGALARGARDHIQDMEYTCQLPV